VLCRTVGCDHWQIAIVQAALFAATVLLTYLIAREVHVGSPALAAALVALYAPIAYYAALALSETVAVFLLAAAVHLYLRARTAGAAWAFAAGAACGFLAITRPVFTLLPALFVVAELLAHPMPGSGRVRRLSALILGAVLFVGPFLGYSFANFGNALGATSATVRFSGYLQGKVAGAGADVDRLREAALVNADDATVAQIGAHLGLDAFESVEVAGAFRDVAVFAATEGRPRIAAFLTLQDQLGPRADRLIAHDPVGYAIRGLTIRTPALWAGDVPVRSDQLEQVPLAIRALLIVVELLAFVAAVAGAIALIRTRTAAGLLVAGVFFYVWLLALPFLTDGRYAIPARPFVAITLLPVVGWLPALRPRLK
jgi:4-amino-4-deoxy-L-arabinose transferase-like glycosyltransferase